MRLIPNFYDMHIMYSKYHFINFIIIIIIFYNQKYKKIK
jgi:hypothetical protein